MHYTEHNIYFIIRQVEILKFDKKKLKFSNININDIQTKLNI